MSIDGEIYFFQNCVVAVTLQLFQQNRVDLVLSDHLLVGDTGTQLSQQMKQQRPEVPVAILSGVVDEPEDMRYVRYYTFW